MSTLRNTFIILGIVVLLGTVLWLLFSWSHQAEGRLRTALGAELCRNWRFRGLRQNSLEEISVRELVIPGKGAEGASDLLVLAGVRFRSDGPLVPSLHDQTLKVSCAGGELNIKKTDQGWNWAEAWPQVFALLREGKIARFDCRGILHMAFHLGEDKDAYAVRLGEVEGALSGGGGLEVKARLYHQSLAGGTARLNWQFSPPQISAHVQGHSFGALQDLIELMARPLRPVRFGGIGDVEVVGRGPPGKTSWRAEFRATNGEIHFTALGLRLQSLVGTVVVNQEKIVWEKLTGTVAGTTVSTEGHLDLRTAEASTVRVDSASVGLSTLWSHLQEDSGGRLRSLFRPDGVARGTLFILNPLAEEKQCVQAELFSGHLRLGSTVTLRGFRLKGFFGPHRLTEGEFSWESLQIGEVSGESGGGTVRAQKKPPGYVVRDCTWHFGKGTVWGEGQVESAPEEVLMLHLITQDLPLGTFFRAFGLKQAPRALIKKGSVEVAVRRTGLHVRAKQTLSAIRFGAYAQALLKQVGADPAAVLPEGYLVLEYENDRVRLDRLIGADKTKVVVLRGTISVAGHGHIEGMLLPTGDLSLTTLFSTAPNLWPLTAKQRGEAKAASLLGDVSGANVSTLNPEELFKPGRP